MGYHGTWPQYQMHRLIALEPYRLRASGRNKSIYLSSVKEQESKVIAACVCISGLQISCSIRTHFAGSRNK